MKRSGRPHSAENNKRLRTRGRDTTTVDVNVELRRRRDGNRVEGVHAKNANEGGGETAPRHRPKLNMVRTIEQAT
eukprot:6426019-Pyramimonas_sp.AAC.1